MELLSIFILFLLWTVLVHLPDKLHTIQLKQIAIEKKKTKIDPTKHLAAISIMIYVDDSISNTLIFMLMAFYIIKKTPTVSQK